MFYFSCLCFITLNNLARGDVHTTISSAVITSYSTPDGLMTIMPLSRSTALTLPHPLCCVDPVSIRAEKLTAFY
jgi:hypothetical protein